MLILLRNKDSHIAAAANLRPTVSRPVCPGVRRPSGTCDQFFFLHEISFRQLRVCNFVASSLTRGRVYKLLYNCFWDLPEQSLLGEITQKSRPYFTVSSETPPTWRARSPYLEVTLVQCEISNATIGNKARLGYF
jgi:hypothetical protein